MAKEKTSKRAQAISIMNANKDKSMSDVVALIAKTIDVTEANARSYYRWIAANGLATANVEAKSKAEKPAKVKAEKPVAKVKETKTVEAKPKGNRFTGKVKADAKATAATDKPKTPDEIAKIKAANLKRMQEVTAKMKKQGLLPGQYANPENVGVPDGWSEDAARAEVDQMYKELDSFEMPKFLTKDQVKALV